MHLPSNGLGEDFQERKVWKQRQNFLGGGGEFFRDMPDAEMMYDNKERKTKYNIYDAGNKILTPPTPKYVLQLGDVSKEKNTRHRRM